MKKELAIKGHRTRGKEVIEILQMLGGGKTVYSGTDTLCIYFLNDSGEITSELYRKDCSLTSLTYDVFTLEEFLEKFPFKINDRVINCDYGSTGIITEMVWDCNNCSVKYCAKFDDFGHIVWFNRHEINLIETELFREDNIDPLHELCENLCNNKLSRLMIDSEVCDDEVEIILNDYEIEVRDGKTYAVKKKPKYPTTYEECSNILAMTFAFDYPDIRMVSNDEFNLYTHFIKLIRCRDAYWVVAGKQMGLGKSWEPDWTDNNEKKYIINFYQNEINFTSGTNVQFILAFPTAEMRDAFYERFKDLIEKCKQLL